eukprot:2418393-Rhodomonas_salina.4
MRRTIGRKLPMSMTDSIIANWSPGSSKLQSVPDTAQHFLVLQARRAINCIPEGKSTQTPQLEIKDKKTQAPYSLYRECGFLYLSFLYWRLGCTETLARPSAKGHERVVRGHL